MLLRCAKVPCYSQEYLHVRRGAKWKNPPGVKVCGAVQLFATAASALEQNCTVSRSEVLVCSFVRARLLLQANKHTQQSPNEANARGASSPAFSLANESCTMFQQRAWYFAPTVEAFPIRPFPASLAERHMTKDDMHQYFNVCVVDADAKAQDTHQSAFDPGSSAARANSC